jgi:hypothetical protein
MRKLIYVLTLAAGFPLLVACDKSLEDEAQDVREAHEQAVQDVSEEQRDVDRAAREGAENITREQRDVEDAARRGTEKIIEEKRELEDEQRAREKAEADRTDVNRTDPVIP